VDLFACLGRVLMTKKANNLKLMPQAKQNQVGQVSIYLSVFICNSGSCRCTENVFSNQNLKNRNNLNIQKTILAKRFLCCNF
jgi:hypothetical protein